MSRQAIISQLERYGRANAGEEETVARFVRFVREHEACCERSLAVGHVTGSAWVVNHAKSHVLLTHHKKLDRWLQLGGHADGDCNLQRVALREAQEESGLADLVLHGDDVFDIDIHRIPERHGEGAHFHYDMRFAIKTTGSEIYDVSDESHDLKWVEITNIGQYTQEDSMTRMAWKWLARTSAPR